MIKPLKKINLRANRTFLQARFCNVNVRVTLAEGERHEIYS